MKSKFRKYFRPGLVHLLILLNLMRLVFSRNQSNYLILKNEKVFALGLHIPGQGKRSQLAMLDSILINNDQQYFKLQFPVRIDSKKQLIVSNYSQIFPTLYSQLQTKGYIRPIDPFAKGKTQNFLKGYKYKKPAFHDSRVYQTYEQISAFIKSLMSANNLNFLNLRMQDSFRMEIIFNSTNSSLKIKNIQLKYLFVTVSKDSIPEQILTSFQNNIQNHNKFLSNQNIGILQRSLHGKGLHQSINHTILFQDLHHITLQQIWKNCFFQFTDVLPENTYIDVDQRREETTNYETINIERPAFAEKQYFYKYRVSLAEFEQVGVRKYTYHQPIHFRYPAPSLQNSTKIYLHPVQQVRIECKRNSVSNWSEYKIDENLLFDRGSASIPNADVSKERIVSMITLLVCLLSVVIIIKSLKRN